MMSDIFISYSKHDRKKAEALANALEQSGPTVWFDRSINPGSTPPFDVIEKQINQARCVLVLWSKSSVASQSVRTEATAAHTHRKLIPVIIDKDIAEGDDRIPLEFRFLPTAKLAGRKLSQTHPEFKKLLAAVDSHIKGAPPQPPVKIKPADDLNGVMRWNVKLALALAALSLLMYFSLTVVPRDNAGLGWDWEHVGGVAKITWVKPGGPAVNVLEVGDELVQIGDWVDLSKSDTVKEAIRHIERKEAVSDVEQRERYKIAVRRGAGREEHKLFAPRPDAKGGDNLITALLHVLIIIFFILLIFGPKEDIRQSKIKWSGDEARRTFYQFIKGWAAVWTTWLVLYLFIAAFSLLPEEFEVCEPCYLSVIDFLNISNSVVFFYIFFVLDMPSVPSKQKRGRDRRFRKALKWVYSISSSILLLSVLGRFRIFELHEFGPFLSGFLVAISMSYVFGRLDSHYMDVDRWMLAPLYFYAVIQVIGPILIELRIGLYQTLFFILVLALKLILFFVFYSWQRESRFEKYINKASQQFDTKKKKMST